VRVQTSLSPAMLPITMNPDAEKIVRALIRSAGPTRLNLLAGATTQPPTAPKKPRESRPGSATAKAMEHPMVQQAQRLFDAEIQTVIDLTGKD